MNIFLLHPVLFIKYTPKSLYVETGFQSLSFLSRRSIEHSRSRGFSSPCFGVKTVYNYGYRAAVMLKPAGSI
jgi:hypothetical protein